MSSSGVPDIFYNLHSHTTFIFLFLHSFIRSLCMYYSLCIICSVGSTKIGTAIDRLNLGLRRHDIPMQKHEYLMTAAMRWYHYAVFCYDESPIVQVNSALTRAVSCDIDHGRFSDTVIHIQVLQVTCALVTSSAGSRKLGGSVLVHGTVHHGR